MVYWQLFLAFFRVGIFGYGGGPTMIPLVHTECVKKYQWVSSEEFADNYALGNALPGPIATKMAAYVGYKVKGWLGSFIAVVAVSLPVVIVMIALLQVVTQLKDAGIVRGMIDAIQPVIGVMMVSMTWEFVSKGWKAADKQKVGFIALIALALIALLFINLHPGLLVAIFLLGAFLYSTWKMKQAKRQEKDRGMSA
ncbi:chromate transporter [Brevibacillus fulvus]|uniref:Chromate transporter n=1 Tax=Brevibacillus fulvus TaxID=1125967 RepID=A0A938XUH6_9BACL|nr:chromate transporter [Brevibacillus fulvus]MBM7590332.1 chromate transporter [Brevibacillus fulvus]